MKCPRWIWFSPLLLLTLMAALAALALAQNESAAPKPRSRPDLTAPQDKPGDERFNRMHQEFVARAKQGNVGLLFLGDSITAGWMTRAKDLFEAEYAQYNAANFGIGGDHVYGVLWRILNGELENISPKVIVLMIGTNDSSLNSGDDIAHGVEHLIRTIHGKSPKSKVLLLGMLPRGPRADKAGKTDDHAARMNVIRSANARLAQLDNGSTIRYLDIGPRFVDADGAIPKDIMPDQLHPSRKGYEIWADAMRPTLQEMMK